jgi:hypothetical protein
MPRAYLEFRLKASVFAAVLATVLGGAAVAEEDGQWTMPGKDYAATRYSGLDQINAGNAKGLHPVWTFSTGVLARHQGQPLVVKNTMYVVTPYPNVLYACVRPYQRGLPPEVAVSSGGESERHRDRVLRPGEIVAGPCRQQDTILGDKVT